MKVKNDHRSKFSNLSNWKEEAWKNQSFKGIRTRDLRVTGALLYQAEGGMDYWLGSHEGERSNCLCKFQLVGQKYRE